MTKREVALDVGSILVVLLLWLAAMFWDSPIWIVLAVIGSAAILWFCCWMAMRN